jgi:hypothetical protein
LVRRASLTLTISKAKLQSRHTLFPSGTPSIDLPQPVTQRARLWKDFCKKKGLGVGPHDGVVVDLSVPAGTEEPEATDPPAPQPAPAKQVRKTAKPTRKAPAK